jgi:gliding motility-associated-like protein
LKKAFLSFTFALVASVAMGQDVFLKGAYVEVGIHTAGSFGSNDTARTTLGYHPRAVYNATNKGVIKPGNIGFVCDYQKDGWTKGTPAFMGDYFVPGTPEEGWGVEWDVDAAGSSSINKNMFGLRGVQNFTVSSHVKTTLKGIQISTWKGYARNGSNQELSATQITRLDSLATSFTIEVQLKNTGTDTLYKVEYLRNLDPDNEVTQTNSYATSNYVDKQPGKGSNKDTAIVVAIGPVYGVPCILGTIDKRAIVSVEGFSNRDPDAILDSPREPTKASPSKADEAIALAYRFGKLAPGQCVIFTYYYALAAVNIGDVLRPVKQSFMLNNTTDEIPIDQQLLCGDTVVTFKNRPVGAGVQYIDKTEWDFNADGKFDKSGDSVVYKFPGFGKYKVTQRITLCTGTKFDSTFTIRLYPKPVPNFSAASNPNRCLSKNKFNFINKTGIYKDTVLGYTWNLGDKTATKDSISYRGKKYSTPGSYAVKLIAESVKGCKDSAIKTIRVLPDPKVNFSLKDSVQCFKYHRAVFQNLSTVSTGKSSYQWRYGDGAKDTSTNVSHRYSSYGSYFVKLISTTDSGCIDSLSKLYKVLESPVSIFSPSATGLCLNGNSFKLANSSKYSDTSKLTYIWQFSDGTSSISKQVSKSFANYGKQSILLITSATNGCKDSMSKSINVWAQVIANFTLKDTVQCYKFHTAVGTNTSTVKSGVLTKLWRFGDGKSDTSTNTTHRYSVFGYFPMKLVVKSDSGCLDSLTKLYHVLEHPSPSFTISDTARCFKGNSFQFLNTSKYSDTSKLRHLWYPGDGSNVATKSITKKYGVYGDYTVMLVSTANNGCKDSTKKTVHVWAQPKSAFYITDTIQCYNVNSFKAVNQSTLSVGSMIYSWQYSDGSTDTGYSPANKRYKDTGRFQEKLIVTSNHGCKDTSLRKVRVLESPFSAIGLSDTMLCFRGNTITITDKTKFSVMSSIRYKWYTGGGDSSILQNPPIAKYITAGYKTIRLITRSTITGCNDSTKRTILIAPQSNVGFTINKDSQCLRPNSFSYTNSSTIPFGKMNYSWNLGDGRTDTSRNIGSYHYANAGAYVINLVTKTDKGCKDTLSKNIALIQHPKASFTTPSLSQCLKYNSFLLINSSTPGFGTKVKTWWNKGLGGADTQSVNYLISYKKEGSYSIRQIVSNDFGCLDTITKSVNVFPQVQASLSVNKDSQCLRGNSFVFGNGSKISTGSFKNLWDFGDASMDTVLVPKPKSYTKDSAWKVTLITTSDKNCRDTISKMVVVKPMPSVKFGVNKQKQCFVGNAFDFVNESKLRTGLLGNNLWSFGDGKMVTSQNLMTHNYNSEDSFKVKLVQYSDFGCVDSFSMKVTTMPMPRPGFAINKDSQCLRGNAFNFTNFSTIPYGTITSKWFASDGDSSLNSNWKNKVFSKVGNYTVTLAEKSDFGCAAIIILGATVKPHPATWFRPDSFQRCFNGNQFDFLNTSTISSGLIKTYYWSFGDGATSASKAPFHAYTTADSFVVTLKTVSEFGCADSLKKRLWVRPQTAINIAANTSKVCFNGHKFNFTNNSTIPYGSFANAWELGDFSTSLAKSISNKSYAAPGVYTVKIKTVTNFQCLDSFSFPVSIYPNPKASFNFVDTFQCFNSHNVNSINKTTITSGTYSNMWNLGDGRINGAAQMVNVKYGKPAQYLVMLVTTSDKGCVDSSGKWMDIRINSQLSLDVNKDSQCFKYNLFDFKATNLKPSITVLSYYWDFGNGMISNLQDPLPFKYTNAGKYNIRLISNNSIGCNDSLNRTVTVHPDFKLQVQGDTTCFPGWNKFQATTNINSSDVAKMQWEISDGTRMNVQNFTKFLKVPGEYDALFWTQTKQGCRDSISKSKMVWLKPKPTSLFSYKQLPFNVLDQSEIQFTNTSSNDVKDWEWEFKKIGISSDENPYFSFIDTGVFTMNLIVKNGVGCMDTSSQRIGPIYPPYIMHVPNAFTPNANNLNEGYKPVGTKYMKFYEMVIYNRWGQQIYKCNSIHESWDGTFGGKPVPEGAYVARIQILPMQGPRKIYETTVHILR